MRAQQRCIPPLIDLWLDQFGEEQYDGHGGVVLFFSHTSIRAMERTFGRAPVRKLAEYLHTYKVASSIDGSTITVGHRTRRVRRK
jgi:lantibiotic modifying enzyme